MAVEAREIVTPPIWQRAGVASGQMVGRVPSHGRFHLGFSRELCELRSNSTNMVWAGELPQVVRKYLNKEVAEKRVWVVGATGGEMAGMQSSPFGVIPKKGKPGRWRLILNLSVGMTRFPKIYAPWDMCLCMTWLERH